MPQWLITIVCFVLAIAIMGLVIWMDRLGNKRQRELEAEYQAWKAEHGFKEKKR